MYINIQQINISCIYMHYIGAWYIHYIRAKKFSNFYSVYRGGGIPYIYPYICIIYLPTTPCTIVLYGDQKNFGEPKKERTLFMCPLCVLVFSHYPMFLFSHSSEISPKESMKSYRNSSGRYIVFPFKYPV